MQIHELNNYTGDLDSGAYLAVDNGTDTGKVSTEKLLSDVNSEIGALDASLNARIDNIIAGGTAPSVAEVTDARLGENQITYSSLGDAIRGQYKIISDYINGFDNTYNVPTAAVSMKFPASLLPGVKYKFTNNTSAGCSLRLCHSDGTNQVITTLVDAGESREFCVNGIEPVSFGGYFSGTGSVSLQCDFNALNDYRYIGVANYINNFEWEIGSIYGASGENYNGITRGVRSPQKIFLENDLTLFTNNPKIETVYAFKYDTTDYEPFIERLGTSGEKTVDLQSGYFYRLLFLAPTGTVITLSDIDDYISDSYCCGETLSQIIKTIYPQPSIEGYSLGPDLLKKKIAVERVGSGSLKYHQSFLIYGGKYYSTDGDNIAVQSDDFTVEQDIVLAVGHGNAFVLGSSNIGYISGWDDNKIYAINLDTLSLDSTITLPVTGYTTCAVDDINGIAYIFQRDTQPNTESIYNVITYDYVNDEIIDTYKTTIAFGAMQACDLYEGRIIVINGLGTNTLPNGYRIFNRHGDVLANYIIPDFSAIEPEGVFFDRNTGDLYLSNINKELYKISAL